MNIAHITTEMIKKGIKPNLLINIGAIPVIIPPPTNGSNNNCLNPNAS
jgi:hypothetical protein